MSERNFTLETELERLLQWKRDCVISSEGTKQADEALFIFNLGLLCGLKEANRKVPGDEYLRNNEPKWSTDGVPGVHRTDLCSGLADAEPRMEKAKESVL